MMNRVFVISFAKISPQNTLKGYYAEHNYYQMQANIYKYSQGRRTYQGS